MTTLAVNSNNDMYTINGNVQLATGLQALINTAKQNVMTILGELVFNTDQGIPYFDVTWNGNPNIIQTEDYIRTAILNTNGVTNILELNAFVNNNVFSYNAKIETIYGGTTIGI